MKTYIIAEAGVNHNGDVNLAKKLVDIAVKAKANAVKFQTWITENVMSKTAPKAEYQIVNTGSQESQFEMEKKLELTFDEFIELKNYCDENSIEFLSTPFDFESADFLINSLKLNTIKIPSGEITNAPLLLYIAKHHKNIILSTGMATVAEIQQALGVIAFGLINDKTSPSVEAFERAYISEQGQQLIKERVSLLHCTTEYPAPIDEINLLAMKSMENVFGLPVGYSDHTEGIEISIAAVALGATIIEKHITYDKNAEGPDHAASIEPLELNKMVESIRNVEKSIGNGIKIPSKSELKNREIARKSLVASEAIKSGEYFSHANLAIKRPGSGLSPFYYWELQNQKATRDFNIDEEIN